jgi:hypothetical protein
MKTLCNYDIMNKLFYQKNISFMILLHLRIILFPYKLRVTGEENICKHRNSLFSNGFYDNTL